MFEEGKQDIIMKVVVAMISLLYRLLQDTSSSRILEITLNYSNSFFVCYLMIQYDW